MAYISTEQVKSIRDQIKAAYPRYKWSVSRRHSSTVVIVLQASDLPIDTHVQVNQYYLKETEKLTTKGKLIFQHVMQICNSVERCYDRNAGDVGADYGDSSYFIDLDIGLWDKPHKIIPALGAYHQHAKVGHVMTPAEHEAYSQECLKNQAEIARADKEAYSLECKRARGFQDTVIKSWNHGSMKVSEVLVI